MLARAGEGIAKGRQGGILPVSTARYEAALLPRPVESTCPPVATALVRPCLPWKAWQHREVQGGVSPHKCRRTMLGNTSGVLLRLV